MKITTTIKLPTYSCELLFIVTDQLKTESQKIYKKYKLQLDDDVDGENEGILLTPDIDKYFLIIDTKYLTHNTIAHEIYHAVVRVTEDRGISDEEAQAWLCGHITAVIYKFLDKKKFEIKHGR
jgi:hypothetical protein